VTGSYAKSIQLLKQIYTDYPESPRAADAEFLEAYTYANDLQDYDTAQKLYMAFTKKHPNHPMFSTTVLELKNLGKTPEMMIEEFKKMNKEVK
jgi:TolA-binding protein